MLNYVHNLKILSRLVQDMSDQSVLLCKVQLVGTYIKGMEEMNGSGRITPEKLREQKYKGKCARILDE